MRASGERLPAQAVGSKAAWLTRLRELGLELPAAPKPLGAYSAAAEAGGLLFLSGMLPLLDGKLMRSGRIGADLSIPEGKELAAQAVLNGLSVAREYLGDASQLDRVVRVSVSMAVSRVFTDHAAVADGASEILAGVFPDAPGHTRMALGVESLPMGSPVAVELLFALKESVSLGE